MPNKQTRKNHTAWITEHGEFYTPEPEDWERMRLIVLKNTPHASTEFQPSKFIVTEADVLNAIKAMAQLLAGDIRKNKEPILKEHRRIKSQGCMGNMHFLRC